MDKDETETAFLKPLRLDSTQEWSATLPPIKGESDLNKMLVTVNFGETASFISYVPSERTFVHKPSTQRTGIYSIEIKITNKSGKSASFTLRVIYQGPEGEKDKN